MSACAGMTPENEALAAKLTAVLTLVGIVMLPVIKFSLE